MQTQTFITNEQDEVMTEFEQFFNFPVTATITKTANAANVANVIESLEKNKSSRIVKGHGFGKDFRVLIDADYRKSDGTLVGIEITRVILDMIGRCTKCPKKCIETCVGSSKTPLTSELIDGYHNGFFSNPVAVHGESPLSAVIRTKNLEKSWKASFLFASLYADTDILDIPEHVKMCLNERAPNFKNCKENWMDGMIKNEHGKVVDEDLKAHYEEQMLKFDVLERMLQRVCPGDTPTKSKVAATNTFRVKDVDTKAISAAATAVVATAVTAAVTAFYVHAKRIADGEKLMIHTLAFITARDMAAKAASAAVSAVAVAGTASNTT